MFVVLICSALGSFITQQSITYTIEEVEALSVYYQCKKEERERERVICVGLPKENSIMVKSVDF